MTVKESIEYNKGKTLELQMEGEKNMIQDLYNVINEETGKSSDLSVENPIDKIVILANDALLTALQQSENAQVAYIKNSAKDCKIYVMNVKYELGKYRAYMEIIRQVNYNLWLQMYARDNANMLKLDKVNELI